MKKSRTFDVAMFLIIVALVLAVALAFERRKAAECEAELKKVRPPVIQQAETPAEKPAAVPEAKPEQKVKPRAVKTKPKQRPISQADTLANGDGMLIKESK